MMKIEHVSSIYADEMVSISALVFIVHVRSSTDAPALCALLAFVTTPKTQKKKSPHEWRTRAWTYQQGFLKILKFPSWHGRAARRHGDLECLKILCPRMYAEKLVSAYFLFAKSNLLGFAIRNELVSLSGYVDLCARRSYRL